MTWLENTGTPVTTIADSRSGSPEGGKGGKYIRHRYGRVRLGGAARLNRCAGGTTGGRKRRKEGREGGKKNVTTGMRERFYSLLHITSIEGPSA